MSAAPQMDIEAEKPSGTSVKSPWAPLPQNAASSPSAVTSLADVMSEQLAFEMTKKEQRMAAHEWSQESQDGAEAAAATTGWSISSDSWVLFTGIWDVPQKVAAL